MVHGDLRRVPGADCGKRPMTLFFDLDGPILDVSRRYYRLHSELVLQLGGMPMDEANYWERKRDREPLSALLALDLKPIPGESAQTYRQLWREKIEWPASLAADTVVPGAREQLAALQTTHHLVLVTLRQCRENLEAQLERLQLGPFFEAVISAAPPAEEAWKVKQELIRSSSWMNGSGCIVGDTEVDIRAGKALGLITVAVLSGIRNRRCLALEKPDFLVEGLRELPRLVESR